MPIASAGHRQVSIPPADGRSDGLVTVALTGKGGGQLAALADMAVRVPSDETPRIQESHIAICHAICEVVDAKLLREESAPGEGGSRA